MHEGHDHNHSHGHDHSHDHAAHTHPHEHEHTHAHKHDNEHSHAHEHTCDCGHDHMEAHEHKHDESHEHTHAETCDCGHDHGTHAHGAHGHAHNHGHKHKHTADCDCGHDHSHSAHDHAHDAEISELESIEPGVVAVTVHEHDDAIVASGALIVYSDEPHEMRHAVADEVEFIASEIGRCGGIVGHIKASFVATSYDMLSVTEAGASISLKRAPELELKIGIAAIAFGVPPEFVQNLVRESLESLVS